MEWGISPSLGILPIVVSGPDPISGNRHSKLGSLARHAVWAADQSTIRNQVARMGIRLSHDPLVKVRLMSRSPLTLEPGAVDCDSKHTIPAVLYPDLPAVDRRSFFRRVYTQFRPQK